MDPERIALIRERLTTWMDGKTERGGVFLVARRGKIVLHEALGPLTDKAGSPAMEKDSIFQVSSISKLIAATAIMMLVEDGLLGLNRPIKEYFPEICGEGTDDIEVQHLLTHSSGFREEECWVHYRKNKKDVLASPETPATHQHQSIADYLKAMEGVRSYSAPGSLMHYGSHNFILLADLIRRVSGMSTQQFLKERLFDPLGMTSSYGVTADAPGERSVVRGEGFPAGSIKDDPINGPEGLWMSSASWGFIGNAMSALDLASLAQTYLNGGTWGNTRLLSAASVHEMTRDQLPGIKAELNEMRGAEASWGLGWAIQGNHRWPWHSSTLAPRGTFWHTGSGGSQIWVDPVNEIVGVYLSVYMIMDETVGLQWHGDMFMNMVTAAVVD